MPHIEIVDVSGQPFRLSSSNPELIGQWLVETIAMLTPSVACPVTVRVHAGVVYKPTGESKFDWPPNVAMSFQATLGAEKVSDNVRRLVMALQEYADKVAGEWSP